MHRLFETSAVRRQRSLDGPWEFVTDPDETVGPESFPADADELYVPCAWNTDPAYYDYEGVAWYRRTFTLPERTNATLTFDGVAHHATVYLDGAELGSHYGGYTPFSVHLAALDAGEHELLVRVDNTHDETTMPKSKVDWAHYGGVTRSVTLEETGDLVVDDLRVEYDLDDGAAVVEPVVELYDFGGGGTHDLDVFLDGEHRATTTVTVDPAAERTTATASFVVDDPDRWSPDDPTLHDLRVEVAGDEYRDRVGFRSVEVTPTDILVNGEAVSIDGVNRHEDHPEWGHGVPPRIVKRDVDLLQRAGLDAVRTSHYPNDPVFLDYCDREGVLVVEEIPYWQYDEDDFARDVVLDRGKRMLAELITRDYNRPSVVAWSLHNECETHQEGVREATAELVATARDHDTTRPLTFATNNHYLGEAERCAELVDFLSVNGYWGWYSHERTWAEFLASVREEFPEMPIVVSEFGAGAVAGERGFEERKWSEQYQAEVVTDAIATFRDTEYVAGYFVWQYFDTNTAEALTMSRPKAMNNKGILDAYRRPKEAYRAVERLLGGESDDPSPDA